MLEMDYAYNTDGTIENLVFTGLDGTESVTTLKEALALLRVSNPFDDYRRQLEAGELPPMTTEETDTLLKTLRFLDELWWTADEKGSRRSSMNVLMLLAKALESLLNNYVRTRQMVEEIKGICNKPGEDGTDPC